MLALGVPQGSQFLVTTVLVQLHPRRCRPQNAANARLAAPEVNRTGFSSPPCRRQWEELDPDDYPFTRTVADQMRGHDDREQFLAGIDLVLAGIATVR